MVWDPGVPNILGMSEAMAPSIGLVSELQNQLLNRLKGASTAQEMKYYPQLVQAQLAQKALAQQELQAKLPLIQAEVQKAREDALQQHIMNAMLQGKEIPGVTSAMPSQNIPNAQPSQQLADASQVASQVAPQPSQALNEQGTGQDFRNFLARHMLMRKTGIDFVGPAAAVESLEGVKRIYGPESSQAKLAQNLFDAQLQQKELSGLTKVDKLQRGYDKAIENGEPEKAEQFQLALQKELTDTEVRKRNLYATNIEKTLDTINPEVLKHYSGPKGKLELAKDYRLSLEGKAPEIFKDYQSVVNTKVPLLTGQVRQFYGESIQPSVRQHLEALGNTATWQDPTLAIKRFEDFKSILNSELQTFRDALKSTNVYTGKGTTKSGTRYSQEDLEYTARKHGISVEQVKRKLGAV